jgi:hypothetical protein
MELGFQAAVQRNFIGSRGGGVHLVHRGRRRWIGRQSSLHRAASQLEVEDDDPPREVSGPGASGLVGWAWPGGLQPGKCFSLFFCFISFLLFPVFCFTISITSFDLFLQILN